MKKQAIRAQKKRPLSKVGDTEQFRNIHKGKKCYVFGAGTSLNDIDTSSVHDCPIVSVNSSALLMPWEESGDPLWRFWVSTDLLCMQWDYFWDKVAKFECIRLVRNSWARNTNELKGIPMHFYTPRRVAQTPKWEDPGLMAGSSVLSALDLSLLMGCKIIIMLGVDHRMRNGNSHFWQFWPVHQRPKKQGQPGNFMPCQRQQSRVFKSNMRTFEILEKYSKSLGAKIYNASPISEVPFFEKISFEDALKL